MTGVQRKIGIPGLVMPMRIQTHLLSLSLLLLVLVALATAATRKEIDWDALEKAWEAGDAPAERRSGADDQYDRLSAISPSQAKAMGPQMVFVTLQTHEPLSELASRWKEMLWNGGVDVTIYEIETAKVLVGLQKGLFLKELRLFLHEQHEVVTYDWNSKTYSRDDAIESVDPPVQATVMGKKPTHGKQSKHKIKKKKKKTHPQQPTHDGL